MHTDCFAYPKPGEKMPDDGCHALYEMPCKTGECRFYKTAAQVTAENMASIRRRKQIGTMTTFDLPYMTKT